VAPHHQQDSLQAGSVGSTGVSSRQSRRQDHSEPNFRLYIHIHEKVIAVQCGHAGQTIQWAGSVAVARWDDQNFEGWKYLGIPTSAFKMDGDPLDMSDQIIKVLEDGEHVSFVTSIDPNAPK